MLPRNGVEVEVAIVKRGLEEMNEHGNTHNKNGDTSNKSRACCSSIEPGESDEGSECSGERGEEGEYKVDGKPPKGSLCGIQNSIGCSEWNKHCRGKKEE